MLLNKQELLISINKIPKFVKRDIYTKASEFVNGEVTESQDKYNKENRLIAITEKEKYPIISTISKWYKIVQFEDTFKPIVEHFEDVDGEIYYYFGSSILSVFPKGNEFITEEGHKIGLVVSNSVTKTLAINVNFCILVNNRKIFLPKNISGFRKLHLGNVEQLVTDYERFIGDIRQSWKIVVSKFSRELTKDDVENVLKELKLGKRYNKKVRKTFEVVEGTNLKLWDLFMEIVEVISEREYKREENRITKLKKISEVVYSYALVEVI